MLVTPQDFSGLAPEYKAVPVSLLLDRPYNSIAQVVALDDKERPLEFGTAWRWAGGVAVTAAHVVHAADHVACHFADGAVASFAGAQDIHPEYFAQTNKPRVGSPEDVAVLRLSSNTGSALEIAESASVSSVKAIGFPGLDKLMVEHEGDASTLGSYLSHSAHTKRGHSGCPLLSDNRVVGIHLGGVAFVAKWRPDEVSNFKDGENSGVFFNGSQIEFLESRAAR